MAQQAPATIHSLREDLTNLARVVEDEGLDPKVVYEQTKLDMNRILQASDGANDPEYAKAMDYLLTSFREDLGL